MAKVQFKKVSTEPAGSIPGEVQFFDSVPYRGIFIGDNSGNPKKLSDSRLVASVNMILPVEGDRLFLLNTPYNSTVSGGKIVVLGTIGDAIDITLVHSNDADDSTPTLIETLNVDVQSPNEGSSLSTSETVIPAGHWVWFKIDAHYNNPTQLCVSLFLTYE